MKQLDQIIVDTDTQWKELIEDLFEDFIAYFMPDVFGEIDWTIPHEYLDKEFPKLLPEYFKGGQIVNDKLVKVRLKNGKDQFLIIHIEVQSDYDEDFARRMFKYFYRIYDKFGENIDAIAILTDDNLKFRPDKYHYEKYKTRLDYVYRIFKIADHKEAELLQQSNPFALAVLATKYMNQTKGKSETEQRLQFKKQLARLLFERGYTREMVNKVLLFIANILALPPYLEQQFKNEVIEHFNTEKTMPLTYENSRFVVADRYGWFQEGKQEGKLEGKLEGKQQGMFHSTLIIALKLIKQGADLKTIEIVTLLPLETIIKLRRLLEEFGDDAVWR